MAREAISLVKIESRAFKMASIIEDVIADINPLQQVDSFTNEKYNSICF